MHLLGSDIIVKDGLPRVLHGVQLVGVVVACWGRLPREHESCSRGQKGEKKEKTKHMNRRLTDTNRYF